MALVDPEYAEEFAVVSAWLAALVPWSVSYHGAGPLGSVLIAVRVPFLELQMRGASEVTLEGQRLPVEDALAQAYPGTHVWGDLFVTTPVTAAEFYVQSPLIWGSRLWALAAVFVLGATVLSVALYREVDLSGHLPVDPVRAMGGLLAGSTLCLAGATVSYARASETVGYPVPVGVVVVGVLAAVLLRIDRP